MFKEEHIPYRDLALTLLLLGISYWIIPSSIVLWIMGVFLILGLTTPQLRLWNHNFWEGITKVMSWIFPPIFMSFIFFLVLVPFGLLFRLFSKKEENNIVSNFHKTDEVIDVSFFERVW